MKKTDAVVAYKGFDKDMKCRGFQFEVGKTYVHNGKPVVCESGFHACLNPFDVWDYYGIENGNRFAKVEAKGIAKHKGDSKVSSKEIRIIAELNLCDFVHASIDFLWSNLRSSKKKNVINSANSAKIGSSGDSAQIGSSGYYAQIGSSGDSAKIGSSGYSAQIGSSGNSAQIGSSGDYAQIGSSGNSAKIGSSGDSAKIGSSGYSAQIGSSGYFAKIGSSGDSAQINIEGKNGICATVGRNSKIKAKIGTPIAMAFYDNDGKPVRFFCGIIGQDGLKEDVLYGVNESGFYAVSDGE